MNIKRSNSVLGALAVGICVALSVGAAHGQPANKAQEINEAKSRNPGLKITINPRTGLPSSVSGLQRPPPSLGASVTDPSEEAVKAAVTQWFATGELSSVYRPHHARVEFKPQNVRRDKDVPGQFVTHVEQRVNDIPVFGSSAKVTVDRGLAVTGVLTTDSLSWVDIDDTTATVTQAQAIDTARAYLVNFSKTRSSVGGAPPMPDVSATKATAELNIFDPALSSARVQGPTRLAWLVSIDTYRVFVDAKTNTVFYFFRNQPSALVRRVFDLGDSATFPGQMVINEPTLAPGPQVQVGVSDDDVALAYTNTGLVYNFYFLVFGRDSFNDNGRAPAQPGGPIESYVRVGGVENAYWCPQESSYCPKADVMIFGSKYAGAIDVVGHEITHGVISYEADLVYADESGAVNESLADIFGTLIEFNVKGNAGNWLIGESLPGKTEKTPLRNMADPHMVDAGNQSHFDRNQAYSDTNLGQPARYDELVTAADPICALSSDAEVGCVHINSGIFNKFAYLISEGGQGVTGIGRQKLARIAYRALTVKLNKSTDLPNAAVAFALSCSELADAKVAQITTQDCDQVVKAQQAVGLTLN